MGLDDFRFRYVTRGAKANRLTQLSVRALRWCHPDVRISIVDANDTPEIISRDNPGADIMHLAPGDDAISARVGRGTAAHLYYWRHSPTVRAALPDDCRFDIYIDSDVIPFRPFPIQDLRLPLEAGRIATAIDEDTILFGQTMEPWANAIKDAVPTCREIGPLIQAGLILSNRKNDGSFYDAFWQASIKMAVAGTIAELPYDDMAVLTALLSQGGPFWTRWLPLGNHWNFIMDAQKEPGLYAIGGHFGGWRAKAMVLENIDQFLAPDNDHDSWGCVALMADGEGRRFSYGRVGGKETGKGIVYDLRPPFAVSWKKRIRQPEEFELSFAEETHGHVLILLNSEPLERVKIGAGARVKYVVPFEAYGVVTVVLEISGRPVSSDAKLIRLQPAS